MRYLLTLLCLMPLVCYSDIGNSFPSSGATIETSDNWITIAFTGEEISTAVVLVNNIRQPVKNITYNSITVFMPGGTWLIDATINGTTLPTRILNIIELDDIQITTSYNK